MSISICKTNSSGETQKIAAGLAKKFLKKRAHKNALVLALRGDLGSGKTTFTQGFLCALGIRRKITSPTFVISKNYKLKIKNYKQAHHVDCYRIRRPKELLNLGFKEILEDTRNIVLIEWPEVIRKLLPKNTIWLKFGYGKKQNERKIKMT